MALLTRGIGGTGAGTGGERERHCQPWNRRAAVQGRPGSEGSASAHLSPVRVALANAVVG